MNRRSFLTNLSLGASAGMLLPILRQIDAHADGDAPPKRFIFFVEGSGRAPGVYKPTGLAKNKSDQPLTATNKLQHGLEPLNPYLDRVTAIQGLSAKCSAPGVGHGSGVGFLSANYAGGTPCRPASESIDSVLGRALPAPIPLLVLGVIASDNKAKVVKMCSGSARGVHVPAIVDPLLAYGSVFGSIAEGGAAKKQFLSRRNLLDIAINDIKRVEMELGGPERQKLQSHLNGLEDLKKRGSRLNAIKHTLRKHAPTTNDKYTSKLSADRLDAQFDIAAASLIAGATNVVTIASGTDNHHSMAFTGLGVDVSKHEIGHGLGVGTKSHTDCQDIIRGFHMELLARLMEKLKAVPEGNGTMLDNTVILFASDAPDHHHPRYKEWPLILIGNLGGKLKLGGRYLQYKQEYTTANLFLSFAHAAGDKRERFGRATNRPGPLPELLV